MKNVSIVVPVYNSAGTIIELVRRIQKTLKKMTLTHEIILINDGSSDSSWQIIKRLVRKQHSIVGINFMANYGQHAALTAGIRISRGEKLVTLDDDLQTPPEEIPKLIHKLQEGFDLVYGVRVKETHGFLRNSCSRIGKCLLAKLLGVRVATSISSYKAFHYSIREPLLNHHGPVIFLDALLCWATTRVGCVEVDHHRRKKGYSGYNWLKLIRHYANMTTSFSQFPLKIASLLGIITTGIGMSLFLFVITKYCVLGVAVPGFTFLAASITLFSGIQMFILGIVGEYLAGVHQSLIGRPAYVIRQTIKTSSLKRQRKQ